MLIYIIWSIIMFCATCGGSQNQQNRMDTWTYKAAVYEHRPSIAIPYIENGWHSIEDNLNIYEDQIRLAALQGAKIIVFPEDGIFGLNMNRSTIYQYLEIVDNPQESIQNPCLDAIPTARNRIQRRLSCAARWYEMYVVANFGTVDFCSKNNKPCPSDGRFQYNSNVVFDSEGAIVARYHKQSLFYEDQFDVPPKVEHIIFDSPLGSFGTFTCFDLLFDDPALFLVENIGVKNIVFPTAWMNKMPEMFTLGIHEGWAIRMGVNLLAAELHLPPIEMQGSGIYSSNDGALVYYNNNKILSSGKLLIADVTTPPKGPLEKNIINPTYRKVSLRFSSVMQNNLFRFVEIDEKSNSDQISIESNNTKCFLNYRTSKAINETEKYAFGIFEGLHHSALNSYIQVCALVKCANLSRSSCGQPTRDAFTVFDTLTLTGQFSSDYIFPSLLVSGANPSKQKWDFILDKGGNRGEITAGTLDTPLISTMLYTRVYNKDNNDQNVQAYSIFPSSKQDFVWTAEASESNDKNFSVIFGLFIGIIALVALTTVIVRRRNGKKSGYIKL